MNISPRALRPAGLPLRDVFRRRGIPVPARVALFLLVPHVWVGLFLICNVLRAGATEIWGYDLTARIVSQQLVRSKKSTRCETAYGYVDAGRVYKEHMSLRPEAFARVAPGTPIQVRALWIFGLETSRPRTEDLADSSIVALVVPALFWNGVMFALFYALCLGPLRERKLLCLGDAAIGRINGKTIRRGKSVSYSLAYAYPCNFGLDYWAEMTVRKSDYDDAQAGDAVLVFYDPLKPRRSVLYKYSQYAVRNAHGNDVPASNSAAYRMMSTLR